MCDLGLEIWNALFNVLQRHSVYTVPLTFCLWHCPLALGIVLGQDFYDACVRLNASHLLEHIMVCLVSQAVKPPLLPPLVPFPAGI
ncbi:hypothetical protein GYMLUDRAFT_677871 [Collybiopsis luxurians FD-317 M1]|uniref:Uncharacterized protein n=1 Tax=Collybiopsis luxurians FD-317 M1 TaxID=944289 RepID=A0A0D0B7A2_9AGAR|nr:hypothetical protein GYMLUDRAFT_677871 [Collybiopsis luxurians FD-317 M1]